jgi:16S rRNA (uracil1498-N3)-methyltransferase
MNRILFESDEINEDGVVMLRDHRAEHIRKVIKAVPGQKLKTGTINGLCGCSTVLQATAEGVWLECEHNREAIKPWFDLILGMPRPLVLKRLWPQFAAMGVGSVVLLRTARVEKYYFSSQWVNQRVVRPLLLEGAMQAGTTHIPSFQISQNFRQFLEDELDCMFKSKLRLLAHPGTFVSPSIGSPGQSRPLLAIGAEGGWSKDEIGMLGKRGFKLFSLGERILRSDTACIALISVIEYMLHAGNN